MLQAAALVAGTSLGVGCSPSSPESNDASATSGDGGARDGRPSPGDAAASDAAPDASVASVEGGSCMPVDAADAQAVGADGPDTSAPGCGDWLSASPSHAAVQGTMQLTAAGRDAGFGSVLDWNITGGFGSGTFTNTTASSATFTCLTPGPVVVTATDPATPGCGGARYDEATVTVQCDAILGPWAQVSMGLASACGVTVNGSARCWGDESSNGALGDGTTLPSTFPVQVSGFTSDASRVSVGDDFACAVTTGGTVWCWGGPPGTGPTPGLVVGLPSVADVSAGSNSVCALTTTGGVFCWGNDALGQLGNGTTSGGATPAAVAGLTGTTAAISVGSAFACALSTTGAVQCWGDNSSSELGSGAPPMARSSASPVTVAGLPPATAVAAGGDFACALASGAVYCWGGNDRSQLGSLGPSSIPAQSSPTPVQVVGLPSDVAAIAAGAGFACALTSGGAVWCWGDNAYGELGNGSVPGTPTSPVPVAVSGLSSGVASLSLGGSSACAVTSAGDILCWGSNDVTQLGNPATTFCTSTKPAYPCSPVPVPIEGAGQPAAPGCAPPPASGWCQQQQQIPPHTLCEDFDEGFPGQLSPQMSAGSTVGEDDGDAQSAPRSMLATTSPTSALNVESTAWASYVSPKAGATFRLQADFKVGSDCFANVSRPVTIARVDYLDVGYTLAYSVSPATSGWGFVVQVGEAESTPQTPGPLGTVVSGNTFLQADQWATLTLSATLGAGGSTGGFSVTPIGGNAPADGAGGGLFGPTRAPASAPVLHIGADAAAHGCSVHIDNVLFDVN